MRALHYSIGVEGHPVCGFGWLYKTWQGFISTPKKAKVTCKNCRRWLGFTNTSKGVE